jgi:hypothetical protein
MKHQLKKALCINNNNNQSKSVASAQSVVNYFSNFINENQIFINEKYFQCYFN